MTLDPLAPSVSGKRAEVPRLHQPRRRNAASLAVGRTRHVAMWKKEYVSIVAVLIGTRGTLSVSVKKRVRPWRVLMALGCGQPIWPASGVLGLRDYFCNHVWLLRLVQPTPRCSHVCEEVMHRADTAAHSASRAKAASILCMASIASAGSLLVGGTSPAIRAVSSSKNSSAFLLYPRLS